MASLELRKGKGTMGIGGNPFTGLERLSDLIRQRNENEVEITHIIGRPAQIGHVGEYLASAIFNIALEESATTPGYDGRFVESRVSHAAGPPRLLVEKPRQRAQLKIYFFSR